MAEPPLLEVRDLVIEFSTDQGPLRAVDGLSFDIAPGATLGLVGESGCGKSVSALSLLGLLPSQAKVSGSIRFAGRELVGLDDKALQPLRGAEIAMIFQDPMSALNPVYTVGFQLVEALRIHRPMSRKEARARAVELLGWVGIPSPAERIEAYPHELSGGMRQRVMIAMALSCGPKLLIADEPTTALDVTIQAQILALLRRLKRELNMSILLITHDFGVVSQVVDEVAVMYAGNIVERATTESLFEQPAHPYTRALLRSLPGFAASKGEGRRLPTIPGVVPDLRTLPQGCRFHERCAERIEICSKEAPRLKSLVTGHAAACHLCSP